MRVASRTARRTQDHPSEQVFKSAFATVGITFKIEEHIAVRRCRQARQTEILLRLQRFVYRLALLAAIHLYAGLFAEPFVCLDRSTLGLPLHRKGHGGERLHSIDSLSP